MSFQVSQNDVNFELQMLEVMKRSIPQGLESMDYSLGQCSSHILCLSRLKLISDEQKDEELKELERLHAIGLDQREVNANRAASE